MTIENNLEPVVLMEIREPYNWCPYVILKKHWKYPRYDYCQAMVFFHDALRLAHKIYFQRN